MERHLIRILRGFLGMAAIAAMVIGVLGILFYLLASVVAVIFFWIPEFNPAAHLLITGGTIIFIGFLCLCYHVGDSDLFGNEEK